jgi:hypothetical protein
MSETTPNSSFRVVLGIGLVAAGALFTLSNLGYMDADRVIPWWPSLLIVYGVLRMLGIWCRPRLVIGLLYLLVGAGWLLHNLGLLAFEVWQLWPLIFIFMGIGVMRRGSWSRTIGGIGVIGISRLRRSGRPGSAFSLGREVPDAAGTSSEGAASAGNPSGGAASAGDTGSTGNAGSTGDAGSAADVGGAGSHFRWRGTGAHAHDQDGVLRVDVFLSTVSRRVTSQQFKGGEVVAVMGGGELDLREAKLADGRARLEMNLFMGGITLRVPEDWAVEFQGTPIMGGVEDQTRRIGGEPKGRLLVTGVLLLSGIVLKN